jgi:hypothetical protein
MSDLGDGEVRTTTTNVDPATGASETYTTTEPRRGGDGRTVWIILGLVAVVAIVALVYLFSQSNTNANQAALDQANINAATASQAATDAAANATQAAGNAASAVGAAADRTADQAAAAVDNAGDAAATAVNPDTATAPASDTPPSSQQ